MMITKRQKQILDRIIKEYIKTAQPVSSQLLEKKYDFKICPATLRNEMKKLTELGFLLQPHTSAGRIPTDKGYRFFVDNLLKKGSTDFVEDFKIEKEFEDTLRFVRLLTETLSSLSSGFALTYLFDEDFIWKDGWKQVFEEPEFKNSDFCSRFIKMVDTFEKEIENLAPDDFFRTEVFIGKENPLPKAKDFSLIISKCRFPKKKNGVLAILGPKRMAYDKNVSLINSVVKLLKDF